MAQPRAEGEAESDAAAVDEERGKVDVRRDHEDGHVRTDQSRVAERGATTHLKRF